jgi:hypothetical protein
MTQHLFMDERVDAGWRAERTGGIRRRTGYSAAIVVNAILLWLINGWTGWDAVPFLTPDAVSVVATINLALVVGILVNTANVIVDVRWVRAAGEVLTSLLALVVVAQLLTVFPFRFDGRPVDWALVTRTVLWFALAGCVLSAVVNLAIGARDIVRQGPASGERRAHQRVGDGG